jgi:hypothetical protein
VVVTAKKLIPFTLALLRVFRCGTSTELMQIEVVKPNAVTLWQVQQLVCGESGVNHVRNDAAAQR